MTDSTAEDGFDPEAALAETIEFLTVRPNGNGWVGDSPSWFGDVVFGGFIVGQAVHAATRTAPTARRIHSLHGYFLRPVLAANPLSHDVRSLRDGRSFALRHVEVTQDGAPVFSMSCSFTADGEGYEYQPADEPVLRPDELSTEFGPGPWEMADLGPTPPEPDGTRRSTSRLWMRAGSDLPDDPHLHAALVAFASDITKTGGRPLHLEGDTRGMISLDHAVWFHRPPRADEWLFFDVHAVVNTLGRGLLRGTMRNVDGDLVVSVAQEMLLRRYEDVELPGGP